jgi:DNA-binding IclR family transcriptional regulator
LTTQGTGSGTTTTAKDQTNQQAAAQSDPIANANSTSKRGYTYEINVRVPKTSDKSVIVRDKNGNVVGVIVTPAETPDDKAIEDAKASVNDK